MDIRYGIKQFFAFLWAWFAIVMIIDIWRSIYYRYYLVLILMLSIAGYMIAFAYALDWIIKKRRASS